MSEKSLTFEQALEQLEEIVKELESGQLPLQDAMTAYKKGVELSQFCQTTLQQAEETVHKMMTPNGEVPLQEGKNDE